MEQITVRIPADTLTSVESEADEHGVSRSQFIRDALATAVGHGEHGPSNDQVAELETEITELEQTVERLRNEKQTLIAQREEHTELVEYVEEERSIRERDAERRREREQAGVFSRAKWWLVGRPAEDTADE